MAKVAFLFCVWKRLRYLPNLIKNVCGQSHQPDRIICINNNPDASEFVNRQVAGRFEVVHNPTNFGVWNRVVWAHQLAKDFDYIVSLDDDQIMSPTFVETLLKETDPRTITGWWSFKFSFPFAIYSERDRCDPGEAAHYVGGGGTIYPAHLYDDGVLDCPPEFQQIDDLWLSAYGFCCRNLFLKMTSAECSMFPNDDVALGPRIHKQGFFEYLKDRWGYPRRVEAWNRGWYLP